MPLNDSDSSDEDNEDIGAYTTTKVLLGYASKEPTDDSFSQLGGRPVSILSLGCYQAFDITYPTVRHGWIRRLPRMLSLPRARHARG